MTKSVKQTPTSYTPFSIGTSWTNPNSTGFSGFDPSILAGLTPENAPIPSNFTPAQFVSTINSRNAAILNAEAKADPQHWGYKTYDDLLKAQNAEAAWEAGGPQTPLLSGYHLGMGGVTPRTGQGIAPVAPPGQPPQEQLGALDTWTPPPPGTPLYNSGTGVDPWLSYYQSVMQPYPQFGGYDSSLPTGQSLPYGDPNNPSVPSGSVVGDRYIGGLTSPPPGADNWYRGSDGLWYYTAGNSAPGSGGLPPEFGGGGWNANPPLQPGGGSPPSPQQPTSSPMSSGAGGGPTDPWLAYYQSVMQPYPQFGGYDSSLPNLSMDLGF